MDTIWTPEFAEAGWLRELKGAEKEDALDDVLAGPAESVQWEGKTYGVPIEHERAVALVPQGSRADPARDVGRDDRRWRRSSSRARGTSSSRATSTRATSCGSTTSWPPRAARSWTPKAGRRSTRRRPRPLKIIRDVANSGRVDPSLSTMQEDQERLAFQAGKGAFMLNWPFVYASARDAAEGGRPDRQEGIREHGLGARSRASTRASRARSRSAARTSGISNNGQNPALATQAALCMTSAKWQAAGGDQRGVAAGHELDLRRPRGPQGLPVRRRAARDAGRLGGAPGDAVLLGRDARDPGRACIPPEEVDPQESIDKLQDNLDTSSLTEGCTDGRRR